MGKREIRLKREQIYEGYQILVNTTYPLKEKNEENNPQISPVAVDKRWPEVTVEWKTARMLQAALEAAGAAGQIVPVSGYRSLAEQRQIYADSLAENGEEFTRKYVALPNTSEHQTGLAIDLGEMAEKIDFVRPYFPDTGGCGRFKALAADYGFIQRYEESKEVITGIACEPWHFRYVGRPHARLMKRYGWCLEEYVEHLKDYPWGKGYLDAGGDIRVCYVPAEDSESVIVLEDEWEAEVSGNNGDGFILTMYREGRL